MSSIEKYMNKVGRQNADEKADQRPKFVPGDGLSPVQLDNSKQVGGQSAVVNVNLVALRSMGVLTPDQSTGQLVDEYRIIKRPVLKYAFNSDFERDYRNNLVMVTSTFPNEGKTYNSICLAMSIVMEMDCTVLLVETDLAKPAIMQYMGINQTTNGLVDLLLGEERDLSRVILKTNIPKLTLLPAGRPHAHANELIASNNMKLLVDDLSTRYTDRIVIFDSPPLLSSNDAVVLANMMGQIVLIIEAGKTGQSAVKEAIERLDGNKNISVILNKKIGGAGAGYGYHGYYGS